MASGSLDGMMRSRINALLWKCTYRQQQLFDRIYPNGVSDDQLGTALRLVERTLAKNRAREAQKNG